MSLIRWEPFTGSDEVFDRLMPSLFGRWPRVKLPAGLESKFEWSPSADISENDKEYLIRAELPAVKKEDVKVTVDKGVVTIAGERKQHTEEKNEKMHRVETFRGSFTRSFSLPENAKADAIRCETKDGVLTVHIPKTETSTAQPRQIKVE